MFTIGAHWDGGPDCGGTCDGPHHGDHLLGLTCQGCGGSAYACFQGSGGTGCSDPRPAAGYLPPLDATRCLVPVEPALPAPPGYLGRHRR